VTRHIGIVMEGVTGRLGTNQHLVKSILAIAADGGLMLSNGDRLIPVPVLLGRDEGKVRAVADAHGGLRWSTDRAACLSDPNNEIYFDVAATAGRFARTMQAIGAGKHVYIEKPVAGSLDEALALARAAETAGVCNGVVQDKLFLPGFKKLRALRSAGFFGQILSARLNFGWWVFDGEIHPTQRPSWNYRKADGGGLVLDMFPHWRYITDNLIGEMRAVSCVTATRVPRRRDEERAALHGRRRRPGRGHRRARQWGLSWKSPRPGRPGSGSTTRSMSRSTEPTVRRWSGFTNASCSRPPRRRTRSGTSRTRAPMSPGFRDHWLPVPDVEPIRNSYRAGWELFLRHVAEGTPFPSPLIEGAKGLQLVDACYLSARERRWVDLPPLTTG
jgi:predicted dehydrogenase